MSSVLCTSAHSVCSDDHMDLTRIFEPDVQIAIWRRPPIEAVVQYLATLSAYSVSGTRQILAPDMLPDLRALPEGVGKDAMASDLRMLADMLMALTDASAIGLRVEAMKSAMCPKFHTDQVGIRLLCTYQGPGTEWIEDDDVHSVPTFAVALLKGSRWPGNQANGALHRSVAPASDASPRILVAADAIWVG